MIRQSISILAVSLVLTGCFIDQAKESEALVLIDEIRLLLEKTEIPNSDLTRDVVKGHLDILNEADLLVQKLKAEFSETQAVTAESYTDLLDTLSKRVESRESVYKVMNIGTLKLGG